MAEDGKPADKPQAAAPLPPIAGKARDLEALRNAVVDAANVSGGLWFSYLFVLIYLVVAVGSVTHRNLLFESPVRLPFLNVDLPLLGFFALGPAIFLVVHAYVLLHFVLLAGKVGVFHEELQAQITDETVRTRLRRQLPSNIFVQFLAGPREVRTGVLGAMLRLIAQISLVVGPIVLLVFFQIQFLPYQHEAVAWWQRLAVVIDLALLWTLWPSVARGETASIRWRDFRRIGVAGAALASLVPIVFVFAVATFPDEWLHTHLRDARFIPWDVKEGKRRWVSPHDLLFAGDVDLVARRPTSLWSNRLVLPNVDVLEHGKFDSEAKIDAVSETASFRDRQLQGAVFLGARLRKVDFTAASLEGAVFDEADLRGAKFVCAETRARVGLDAAESAKKSQTQEKPEQRCTQMQRASLRNARLEKAKFDEALLHEASFTNANLQGASFVMSKLLGARFDRAQFQRAVFDRADLSGARFEAAHGQGASFRNAVMVGAYLRHAELQGADMYRAQLQGATLRQAQLQGASLQEANLTATTFEEAEAQAASFFGAKLDAALFINARFHGAQFWNASFKGAWFGRGDSEDVIPQPAQLQGADFAGAELEATHFRLPPIWRSDARNLESTDNLRIFAPVIGAKSYGIACEKRELCDWTGASFASLKRLIETRVPEGKYRDEALERIAILDPAKPAENEQEMAAAWEALAARPKPSAGDFDRILADHYREIGCDPKNTVYALRRIISSVLGTFEGGNEALMGLLETFERDPKCKNASNLTKSDREVLGAMYEAAQKMRDTDEPPPKQ